MSPWRGALLVAGWEFRRFVKLKQQIIGLLIPAAAFAVVSLITEAGKRSRQDAVEVAVVHADRLPLDASGEPDIRLVPHPASALDSLRAAVGRRDLRGLLVLKSTDEAELVVNREPAWRGAVERVLSQARQRAKLAESRLSAEQVAGLLAPVRVKVTFHEAARSNRGLRLWGIGTVAFMMIALFGGAANVFVSITGEKQARVTEQVVSAISPQSWMDGKILGLTGVALVGAVSTGAVVIAWLAFQSRGGGGLGALAISPLTLALFVLLAALGCLFWLAFFGAVAATIDDPNNSARSTMLFLPMLFSAPAFAAVPRPDSVFAKVVALFPLTSTAGLPVRVMLAEPPWWEIVASLALLVLATWWMRTGAGRIFHFGMLMYGKEASWGEMRRWMRRA